MVSFIVFWEAMSRGCGLFHCVMGGYVERLWSLSLCYGRLWPLSLCFGRLCREVVASFIVLWEVMSRGCGLFHCVWEVMLRGCGLFHCVMGGYVKRLWSLSLCLGGYVERLWPLSLCYGRLC